MSPGPRIVTAFPRRVRTIENVWIPLADGTRLAGRLWLPEDAEADPVPALLEYIPYRKRDFTRGRDEPMHHYFAGHGYACARVDLRGTGASDGVLLDEYLVQEEADGLEVIAWLARQPWCTGRVGMMGKSWGGFNALQIAARRPPALGAVIAVCASDDRYADDAHYMGGCVLNENLTWGAALMASLAAPPDPAVVGDAWRARWEERLAAIELFPARWLAHPLRDGYWRRGSVCEDYAALGCPVFAVGGWADAYVNAVPRLLAGLPGPARGLVGPWAHLYPHDGAPGPAIGFLQEALGWWDRWLKDRASPADGEPAYRVWMQEYAAPVGARTRQPGRWVAEPGWPAPGVAWREVPLSAVGPTAARTPQYVGLAAGEWCPFGAGEELPGDQAPDDRESLVLESAPLGERVEVLGAPAVRLRLCVDRPAAFLAVRLNDVPPRGGVRRVTYGLLNLGHRTGSDQVAPLEPGAEYDVTVPLNHTAWAFAAGHRVRVAVSTTYWPVAWPSPDPVAVTLRAWTLQLPVRPPRAADAALRPFGPPEQAATAVRSGLRLGEPRRTRRYDPRDGETVLTIDAGSETLTPIEDIGLAYAWAVRREYRIRDHDPLSAQAEVAQTIRHARAGWSTRVDLRVRQRATRDRFLLTARLDAWHGATRIVGRTWDEAVPRV